MSSFGLEKLRLALWRYLGGQSGAITVEFVIIFPLILLFLFLIIFVSMAIATASDVQQTAHELARQSIGRLAKTPSLTDVCTDMSKDTVLMNWVTTQGVMLNAKKLAVKSCTGQPDANGFVTVTVTYNFAGSFVQSIGQNLGVDLGIITRSSKVKI